MLEIGKTTYQTVNHWGKFSLETLTTVITAEREIYTLQKLINTEEKPQTQTRIIQVLKEAYSKYIAGCLQDASKAQKVLIL